MLVVQYVKNECKKLGVKYITFGKGQKTISAPSFIYRLYQLSKQQKLSVPAMNVNDSVTKVT